MTKQEILEGNKLIATFMSDKFCTNFYVGMELYEEGWLRKSDKQYYNDLNYHCSWDWLMPVIDKIESLDIKHKDYSFTIYPKCKFCGYYVEIFIFANFKSNPYYWKSYLGIDNKFHSHSNYCNSRIEATYKVAIEFIEWYNNNKKL